MTLGGASMARPVLGERWPRQRLAIALAISATAHLLLFWLAASMSDRSSSASVRPASRIELRLATAQPVANGSQAAVAAPAIADELSRPVDPVAIAGQLPIGNEADAPKPQPQQAESTAVDAPQQAEVDGYLPRSALSRPPVPIDEIDLRWPAGLVALGRQVGTFWMFVDESGVVRKFQSDGPTLAPRLEEIAQSVFLSTRFEPGQRDGQPVKSLIRIEVVFDNRLSAEPAPTVVAERIL